MGSKYQVFYTDFQLEVLENGGFGKVNTSLFLKVFCTIYKTCAHSRGNWDKPDIR